MPLKWQRGVNPYRYNYFGKLRIGPHFRPPQLLEQARNLIQKLMVGGEPTELPGPPLDAHAVNEAVSKLREPRSLAEELLLVHAVGPKGTNRLQSVVANLLAVAVLPSERDPLELVHPAAIFRLVGPPGPEAAAPPELSAFGLVQPGDEQDLQLDIVFDS